MARIEARPVVIDTDPGVDDALAILLALRSPELAVVGLTTVCGNVTVERATANLYRVLRLVDAASKIPVGQGAAAPLTRSLETATHVHGPDGLGELDRFREDDGRPRYPPGEVPMQLPHALDLWARCAERHPRELTLITLGPLTNLALALDRDPALVREFQSIIAMAGAVAVPGNVTPAAEFNVYVDPHAAQRVLQADLPLTLVPLDVTEQVGMSRDEILWATRDTDDPVCRFFGEATGHALDFAERIEGRAMFPFHDPLAVSVAIDPSLVRCRPFHVEVETEGRVAFGATVADRRPRAEGTPRGMTVRAAMEVHAARALNLVRDRLCRRSL